MAFSLGGFTPLLQVFDVTTSLAFYCDVLGFTVTQRWPEQGPCEWAMLTRAECALMVNTAYEADERPSAPDTARSAAHSDLTLYFACDDVDAAHTYLRERGLATQGPIVTFYGMKQLHLHDPDGYEVCLQQPVDS